MREGFPSEIYPAPEKKRTKELLKNMVFLVPFFTSGCGVEVPQITELIQKDRVWHSAYISKENKDEVREAEMKRLLEQQLPPSVWEGVDVSPLDRKNVISELINMTLFSRNEKTGELVAKPFVNRSVFSRGLKVYIQQKPEFSITAERHDVDAQVLQEAMRDGVDLFERFTTIDAEIVDSPEQADIQLKPFEGEYKHKNAIGAAIQPLKDVEILKEFPTLGKTNAYIFSHLPDNPITPYTGSSVLTEEDIATLPQEIKDDVDRKKQALTTAHELAHAIGFAGHSSDETYRTFMSPQNPVHFSLEDNPTRAEYHWRDPEGKEFHYDIGGDDSPGIAIKEAFRVMKNWVKHDAQKVSYSTSP